MTSAAKSGKPDAAGPSPASAAAVSDAAKSGEQNVATVSRTDVSGSGGPVSAAQEASGMCGRPKIAAAHIQPAAASDLLHAPAPKIVVAASPTTTAAAAATAVGRPQQTTVAVVTVVKPKNSSDASSTHRRNAETTSSEDSTNVTGDRPAAVGGIRTVLVRSSSVSSRLVDSDTSTPAAVNASSNADRHPKATCGGQPVRKIDSSPTIASSLDADSSVVAASQLKHAASNAAIDKAKFFGQHAAHVETAAPSKVAGGVTPTAPSRVVVPKIKQIDVVDMVTPAKPSSDKFHASLLRKSGADAESNCGIKSRPTAEVGSRVPLISARTAAAAAGGKDEFGAVGAVAGCSVLPGGVRAEAIRLKPTAGGCGASDAAASKVGKVRERCSDAVVVSVIHGAPRRTLPVTPHSSIEEVPLEVPPVEAQTGSPPTSNHSSPREDGVMKPVTSCTLHQHQHQLRAVGAVLHPKDLGVVGRGATIIHGVAAAPGGGWTAGMTAANTPRSVRDDPGGHNGPVISDVFESLRRQQQQQAEAAAPPLPFSVPVTPCFGKAPSSSSHHQTSRPKTGVCATAVRSRGSCTPHHAVAAAAVTAAVKARPSRSRPTSARSHANQRRKKSRTPRSSSPASVANSAVVVKVKTVKQSDEQQQQQPGTRRTNGRRSRKKEHRSSSRRRATTTGQDGCVEVGNDDVTMLEVAAETPGMTLIGGIGWHIAARCDDMTGVQAVKKFARESSTFSDVPPAAKAPVRPKRATKEKLVVASTAAKTVKRKSSTRRSTSESVSRQCSPVVDMISSISDSDNNSDVFELGDIADDEVIAVVNLPPATPVRQQKSNRSLRTETSGVSSLNRLSTSTAVATSDLSARSRTTSSSSRRRSSKCAVVNVDSCDTPDDDVRPKAMEEAGENQSLTPTVVDGDSSIEQNYCISPSTLRDNTRLSASSPGAIDDDERGQTESYRRRRKSRLNVVEAEIDATVDEIMKTTSGSFSSIRRSFRKKSIAPLQDANGSVAATEKAAEPPNFSVAVPTEAAAVADADGHTAVVVTDHDPDDGAARLVRAYRTMPLRATGGKPPVSGRRTNVVNVAVAGVGAVTAAAEPLPHVQPGAAAESDASSITVTSMARLDRSPRFVRKHDSITSSVGGHHHVRRRHSRDEKPAVHQQQYDSLASSIDLETTLNFEDAAGDDTIASV
jgi:hypothetical protein